MEPWDVPLLPETKKSFSPYWKKDESGVFIHLAPSEIQYNSFKISNKDFLSSKVSHYVQHPIPIRNEYLDKVNKKPIPTFLTKDERKRIRKRKRETKQKEKNELQHLGLIKPDPPKLKYKNYMNIIGDLVIQDPTKAMQTVEKAYRDRYAKMIRENDERKLTKKQKADKLRRKFERDIKKECRACLFLIKDFPTKKQLFKINKNAKQLFLTGATIHLVEKRKFPFVVYAEGGPMAMQRFRNLLLNRIKWSEDTAVVEDTVEENLQEKKAIESKSNRCSVIWEGTLKKRNLDKWKILESRSENIVRKFLSDRNMQYFWTLAVSYNDLIPANNS